MRSLNRPYWLGTGKYILFLLIVISLVPEFGGRPSVAAAVSDPPGEIRSPYAVAFDKSVAVVGTPWQDGYAGAAYVLRRSGDTWRIEQTLVAPVISRLDHFGGSVAVDRDYIAVGAPWHDLFRGAVHVFRYDGRSWNLHQTLKAADAEPDSRFGTTVEIREGVLMVAAGRSDTGAAYRFELNSGQWEPRERGLENDPGRAVTASDQDPTGERALEVFGAIAGRVDPPPAYASAASDSLEWVTASDGVFEDRVEIKWSPVELDAIIYKILRDNVLISVASSQDSLYDDVSGDRGVTYNYCVVVQDMLGGEGTPICDSGSRIIRAPEHLDASDGQFIDGVHLTWEDRSSVENGFYVRRDGVLIATLDQNKRYYVDSLALLATVHDYEVTAFDGNGDESAPATDSGFLGAVLPPLEVAATDGEFANSVRITWIDQGNEIGFVVTRVNLANMDSTVVDTTATDIEEYFDNTATTGIRYRYCVSALNGIGQLSVPGCDEGGIDLAAPMNVAASDSTFDDRVQVTWEDESGLADGYYVWRDGAPLDTVGAAVRIYNDYDAQESTTYNYCVITFSDSGGASPPSCDDGFRMIVLAPTDVSASDGEYENRTEITWESSSTTVALFKIFRDGVFIKSVGEGARTYADEGGTAGIEYVYGVQAVTGLLVTSTTTNDNGRRELEPPINVTATENDFEDRVEIAWTDRSRVETGIVIYRTAEGSAVTDSIGETGANTSSFVDRTGEPGTTYLYQAASFDVAGETLGESELSEEDEGIRTLLRPIGVEATDGEYEDRVEITWSDESNAEDGYRVYRDGGQIAETEDNVTSYIDLSPPFGITSEYSVRAFDLFGTSEADADSGFIAVLEPATLNASDFYQDKIELRWVDVSEVEEGYILQTDSMGVTLRTDTLAAGSTFFTDYDAVLDVTYTYRLWVFAGAAVSSWVEDTGIRPVTQIVTETTEMHIKLKPNDPEWDAHFGLVVSIDGNLAVMGMPHDDDVASSAGAVYVFLEDNDGVWSQEAKLYNQNPFDSQYFGEAVVVSGNNLFVTAPGEGAFGTVSHLTRDAGGVWTRADYFSPSGASAGEGFGNAVAFDGDIVIVGAPNADDGASNSGAAYVFQRGGSGWVQRARVKSSDPSQSSWFGYSVAIDGDRVVVGAIYDNEAQPNTGAAYVFELERNVSDVVTNVNPVQKLTAGALATTPQYGFGTSVGISYDLVVVGTQQGGFLCPGKPGAAYVFKRDEISGSWLPEAQLTASDSSECDFFGDPVAIQGQRVVAGTGGGLVWGYPLPGKAYIFDRTSDGVWTERGKLVAADGAPIGGGVSMSSDRLIIGAPTDNGDSMSEGSAFIMYLVLSPSEVAASDGTVDGHVHLQWRDRADNEEGFIVYRDGVEYATVGADVEFYDDVEAEPGRTYKYAVSAYSATTGFESVRVPDYGWRPPDGNITGRITAQNGVGVENVSVCLEPPPTRALLFDGAGGHVRVPEDGTFNFSTIEDFTVEVWFSYSGSDRSPRLVSKLAPNETDERPLDLGLQRSGRLFFVVSDGTDVARVLSQRNDMADDQWHHVACVHDASTNTLTMFIDGVEEDNASTAGLGDITNDSDIFIGGFEENTWFGGQLDELRVWNTARAAAELVATSSTPLSGDEAGLVGYFPFDAFSGTIVTDFAGDAQYGVFVDGVYRTDNAAPLDVCGRTDSDGNYVLTNIRYAENGTDFRVRPSLGDREFSPAVQTVTLNRGHPVENQVVFADISSHDVSGAVQFAGTGCFEPDVEIRVDNAASGTTDKNGKFSLVLTHGMHTIRARHRDYTYHVAFRGDTLATDSITIDVTDDIRDFVFLNETTYPVSGKVGGGCDRYVGEISVRYRSENNCLDSTFVGNPQYTLDLPPMKYFASATIDRETIPESLNRPDVIEFFQNLGERKVNLIADTDSTIIDDTLDFIYRAPLQVSVIGFEPFVDPGCPQLQLEDGTLLPPGLPIIPQGTHVDLTILVAEVYGDSTCPLDTGMVVIYDEIFDQENDPDTLTVSGGEATYTTFASSPSLVKGRTEGLTDRSFQKAFTVKTMVEGRAPTLESEWVLVTGHIAPEGAEFITVPTTPLPLFVLRDPPGDGSYAFLEKGFTLCNRLWFDINLSGGIGVSWEIKAGGTTEAWVGFGGGISQIIKAHGYTSGKVLIGTRYSSSSSVDLCLTTKQRFSTSADADFIGSKADLYVGAGFTFLFSEVGVIEINACVVEQSTSVGFEPDSIHTAFAFTEHHITDVLIPELESKIAYFEAQQDQDSVDVFSGMRDQWQYQVDYNRLDKLSREDTVVVGPLPVYPFAPNPLFTVPRNVENRSFSAGTNYEYNRASDLKGATSNQITGYIKSEGQLGVEFGPEGKAHFKLGVAFETEHSLGAGWFIEGTSSWNVGYVLSDGDAGDNYTVDIVQHMGGWGDIFDVLGGKSSCPYEPWLDLETDEPNMVRRDHPQLLIDPKERFGVPPDETSTFKLTISNLSDERRDYVVKPVSNSNPGGAIMRLNGAPITDHPVFSIDGTDAGVNSHEATLEVDRGPSRFAYERLALVVEPVCGGDEYTMDSVLFDVYFEGCSAINLRGPDVEPGWTYSHADSAAGKQLDVVLDGYELVVNPVTPNLLEAVGIQYRYMGDGRQGPGPWVDIEEIPPGMIADISMDGSPDTIIVWQPDSLANGAYLPMEDGIYELRAYTVCSAGGRGYSNVSMGTIDRHAPVVFGAPQPSDGELSLGELIGVTFNEPIDCSTVEDAAISLQYADGPLAGQSIAITPVCNGETIYLVPQANAADLDGRRLEASVAGVTDRVGNAMTSTVTWQFDYRRSLFTWSQTRVTRYVALVTPGSVPAELVNGTAAPVDYEITDWPVFLNVAPVDASGRLAPGGSREIEFAIDPLIAGGIHEGQVTVQAVDTTGADTVAVAVLDVVLDVSCAAPDWAVNPGGFEYSMSIVASVSTDDGTLSDTNDLVAAFVGEQLRGLASPKEVAGDTLVFLTVFSNRVAGETVRFEVWDNDRCKRYGSTAERVPFNADVVVGTTTSPTILTAVTTPPGSIASFPLDAGWNWFSTNMASANMSLGAVLSSLAPTAGDIIKSKTAFAVFDPDTLIGWVGTLDTLNNTSGYMIKLTEAGTVVQEGTLADPATTDVPVQNGWNWISYVPTDNKGVNNALADLDTRSFLTDDDIVKSQTAFAEWNNGWFGSLETMQPGSGYRLYLQSLGPLTVFNYPASASAVVAAAPGRSSSPTESPHNATGWEFNPGAFEYNMTVIATVRGDGVDWNSAENLLGAFVGEQCRGIVALMPVTGIDHYVAFAMIHSNELSGETITFRAFDASADAVYNITETAVFAADATSGTLRDPVVLTPESGSKDNIPNAYRLAQNHPNPFNPSTTIRFDLPQPGHVVLTIYNVAGQAIQRVIDRGYPAGSHSVHWDGKNANGGDAASGVYFYQIHAGAFVDVKKMVLLR